MARHIIFSPSFSGRVYKGIEGSKHPEARMDWQALGTTGLVGLIESLMRKKPYDGEPMSRLVAYNDSARRHFAQGHDGPIGKSFALSGLNTAKEMLLWRDSLAFCGYDFNTDGVSDRIDTLNAIERDFKKSARHDGLAERTWDAIRWVESQAADRFADYDIATTTPADLLHPTIARLISGLSAHGACLRLIDPAPDNALTDKTAGDKGWSDDIAAHHIHLLHFDDKKDADEYLALYGDTLPTPWGAPAAPTLRIDAHNGIADNWLTRFGRKVSGSANQSTYTVLSQILPLSIRIQREPVDIQCLLDWLQMPVAPLAQKLRRALANAMASTGGFRNDECRTVIREFIESLSDDAAKQARAKEDIGLFLPNADSASGQGERIGKERLRALLQGLKEWAAQRAAAMDGKKSDISVISQLRNVSRLTEAMLTLVGNEEGEAVDWLTVDSWLSSLPAPAPDVQYEAQVGCQTVVESPSDMADMSDLTVWTNLVGDTAQERDCDFLTSDERTRLSANAEFWDTDKEDEYIDRQILLPLTMSERAILTYYDHEYGQPVSKHPLIMRLEKRYDGEHDIALDRLTTEAAIADSDLKEVERVDNKSANATIKITGPGSLKWPERLSYTALDQVINHPFDYVMEKMLRIRATPRAQLRNAKATKGKVAHAVIERICQPRGKDSTTTAPQIAERLEKEYDNVVRETIESHGALLLKAELRPEVALMRDQLRRCILALSEILQANHLEVTACERSISANLSLLNSKSGEDDISGSIDMTLRDTTDGSNAVIDFKWTDHANGYKEMIAENEAIQLELYKQMLTNVEHRDVSKVAYFIMPAGKLLSRDKFRGDGCEQVEADPTPDAAIVRQVVNSFHYRKRQIEAGIVELGEGQAADGLDYVKDTGRLDLLPLKTELRKDDVAVKSANRFSAFAPLRR